MEKSMEDSLTDFMMLHRTFLRQSSLSIIFEYLFANVTIAKTLGEIDW